VVNNWERRIRMGIIASRRIMRFISIALGLVLTRNGFESEHWWSSWGFRVAQTQHSAMGAWFQDMVSSAQFYLKVCRKTQKKWSDSLLQMYIFSASDLAGGKRYRTEKLNGVGATGKLARW
jgi:hypothetical protein